jgi:hypothetical protein
VGVAHTRTGNGERRKPAEYQVEHQVSTAGTMTRHTVRWSQASEFTLDILFRIHFSISLKAVLIHLCLHRTSICRAAPYEPSREEKKKKKKKKKKGLDARSGGADDQGGGRREDGSAST